MKFNDWLLERLKEKDWSQADLARASGLTRSVISKYMIGRIPDEAALRKLAKAFDLSPEIVFRAAGILPPVPELDGLRAEIVQATSEMSREEQREILNYIRYRKSLEKKQQNAPGGNLANNVAK